MKIEKYCEPDQNYQDETTIYWWLVDDEDVYGVADRNGQLTVLGPPKNPLLVEALLCATEGLIG